MLNLIVILLFGPLSFANGRCELMFINEPAKAVKLTAQQEDQAITTLVKLKLQIDNRQFENENLHTAAVEKFKSEVAKANTEIQNFKGKFRKKYSQLAENTNRQTKEDEAARKKEDENRRERLRDQSHPIYTAQKLLFHRIIRGNFKMANSRDSAVDVRITKDFEMAQMQTTQLQWSAIQVLLGKTDPNEINPSHFKSGAESQIVNLDGINIQMQPNHPVEQVSFFNVMEWITGLNKLSIEGNNQIQNELKRIIPGHQKGMVYDLPTEAQWAFVMQNRGKNNDVYFDKTDQGEVDQYAWHFDNADQQTHTVGTKLPRKIDRGDGVIADFYDLEGNVNEWIKDQFSKDLPGGEDPLVNFNDDGKQVVRGNSWLTNKMFMLSFFRLNRPAEIKANIIGFRLSRTSP
jgi:formylglycine-generating enzyme required for sulfatase activity